MKRTISIDPGSNGGIAVFQDISESSGSILVSLYSMPLGNISITERLRCIRYEDPYGEMIVIMENVGWWHPGDHPSSACAFARSIGFLEGILAAWRIPIVYVAPQTWMHELFSNLPKGPKLKKERKEHIKKAMIELYGDAAKVTLKTADALAIGTWWLKHGRFKKEKQKK